MKLYSALLLNRVHARALDAVFSTNLPQAQDETNLPSSLQDQDRSPKLGEQVWYPEGRPNEGEVDFG